MRTPGSISASMWIRQHPSAPKAVANFRDLAQKGFYDDVVFHRVIPGFVIQGGDGEFGKKASLDRGKVGTGGPGYRFEDEPIKGDYVRGSLAMANAGPNTNGSQFFITVAPTTWLTGKHTIFGEVIEGQDVVDKITAAPRGRNDRPTKDVVVKKVRIEKA